jgi:hypothetical protein
MVDGSCSVASPKDDYILAFEAVQQGPSTASMPARYAGTVPFDQMEMEVVDRHHGARCATREFFDLARLPVEECEVDFTVETPVDSVVSSEGISHAD